jgi:hypothetical protein
MITSTLASSRARPRHVPPSRTLAWPLLQSHPAPTTHDLHGHVRDAQPQANLARAAIDNFWHHALRGQRLRGSTQRRAVDKPEGAT